MMSYFTKIAAFSLFCFIADIGLLHADTTTDLSHKLAIIDSKRDGKLTTAQELEQECLNLLTNVSTPEDSGLIYAEMALVYAKNGIGQPAKKMALSKLALQYPLADTLTVRMYVVWVSSLHKLYSDSLANNDKAILRIELAKVCLNGLKYILPHDLSQATQDLPSVPMFDYIGSTDSPLYQELVRENREAFARRREIEKQKLLVRYRDIFIDKLIYLIKLDPGTKSQIEQLAHSILSNADDAKEVLSLIERKLSGD